MNVRRQQRSRRAKPLTTIPHNKHTLRTQRNKQTNANGYRTTKEQGNQ